MKWQLQSDGRFYDANEGTVVYFDSHSGDTHLITDFAAFLIRQFNQHPLSVDEVLERIRSHIDGPNGSEFKNNVTVVLDELVSLEILERV